uniref:Uncharacterized protein n=1 Tax=Meloidogyne enterolobii TaxID=390850 RepID=A0A6V7V3K3_MELEN|nr:unnamed protein product [Meloidogyne enterolobii]
MKLNSFSLRRIFSSQMSFKGIIGGTYKLLDNYEIPLIGLGTYALWNQEEVDRAVDAALASGYRLF